MDVLKDFANTISRITKYITTISKIINKFYKKAGPVYLAVIICFFLIFFGIQYLFNYLTGLTPSIIPTIPLTIFSIYLIVELVYNNNKELILFQSILIRGLIYLLTHPVLKEIFGFDVEIDDDDPAKSTKDIFIWISKNLINVIIILSCIAVVSKMFIQKVWNYFTFYSNP